MFIEAYFNSISCFGKQPENGFLSLMEDNFPLSLFCGRTMKQKTNPLKKRQISWKRRVDINICFYFTVICVFALMNILYNLYIVRAKSELTFVEEELNSNETIKRYHKDVLVFKDATPGGDNYPLAG